MRKAIFPALILGLFITLSPASGQNQMQDDQGEDAGGFGAKVAGTYIDDGNFPAFGDFFGTQTIGADGTQTATNSNCCNPAALQGPAHGAWIKTGSKEITINSIILLFDAAGMLDSIANVQVVVTFNNQFTVGNAELTTRIFSPGADVQNDPPIVVACGTSTWTKLQVSPVDQADEVQDCLDRGPADPDPCFGAFGCE